MKKVLAYIVVLFPLISFSQVRVVSPPEKDSKEIKYDSLSNLPGFQIEGMVGQELFLRPLASYSRKYGYYSIFTPEDRHPNIQHDVIASHTFLVKKIEQERDNSVFYTLVMEDQKTGLIYKYTYSLAQQSWPFITLGYKAKYEKNHKGKSFVALIDIAEDDINTGKSIVKDRGSVWVFQEVISLEKNGDIGYLYSNSNGDVIALNEYQEERMKLKSDIDKLKKKYGAQLCNLAVKGTIKIGMPKELVRIAKGTPYTINEASYGEQWIYGEYGDDCIYFRNGRVTGWN